MVTGVNSITLVQTCNWNLSNSSTTKTHCRKLNSLRESVRYLDTFCFSLTRHTWRQECYKKWLQWLHERSRIWFGHRDVQQEWRHDLFWSGYMRQVDVVKSFVYRTFVLVVAANWNLSNSSTTIRRLLRKATYMLTQVFTQELLMHQHDLNPAEKSQSLWWLVSTPLHWYKHAIETWATQVQQRLTAQSWIHFEFENPSAIWTHSALAWLDTQEDKSVIRNDYSGYMKDHGFGLATVTCNRNDDMTCFEVVTWGSLTL